MPIAKYSLPSIFFTRSTIALLSTLPLSALAQFASANAPYPMTNPVVSRYLNKPQTPATDNIPQADAINGDNRFNLSLARVLERAKAQKLAEHRGWRRLLYYPDTPANTEQIGAHNAVKSRVVNRFNPISNQAKFFVSKQGATNAEAELTAMLQALFDPSLTGNASVQCRFPARTAWLKQQLSMSDSDLPTADCSDYQQWQRTLQPQSATIIFANEYLDNLPSAFAHSFLRFDNTTKPYYLNYTPKVIPNESQLKFSYKSSIGGNAGEFGLIDYAKGIKEYKTQGRDIWQYPLKLDETQVAQLSRQVYEIKDQILPYYLLDQNCASEILVLLNTLFPDKDFLAELKPAIAPAQIVRRLANEGLIDTGKFEPARTTQLQAERNVAHQADAVAGELLPSRNDPLLANSLGRVSVGYHYSSIEKKNADNKLGQNALDLGYRMVYRDPLDKPVGYPSASQLTALSADIQLYPNAKQKQDTVVLQNATLLQLRSFNPLNTAKAVKNKNAWGLDAGLKQVLDGATHQVDNRHLVANLGFEYGKSLAFGRPPIGSGEIPPNLCYGLGKIATQVGKGLENGYRTGIGANIGCQMQFNDRARGLAELSLPYWMNGESGDRGRYWQPKLDIGAQYDINRYHALRLTASREWLKNNDTHADSVAINYLHYFE